jgi:hypothetical protein
MMTILFSTRVSIDCVVNEDTDYDVGSTTLARAL